MRNKMLNKNLSEEANKEFDDITDKFGRYVGDFLENNVKTVAHVTGICAVLNHYMALLYVNSYNDHNEEEFVNMVTKAYIVAKKNVEQNQETETEQ